MKKIIKTLLVVMVVVLALTALTACDLSFFDKECQHSGGTATCTEKAVCEQCGESYGELLAHKEIKLPASASTCAKEGMTEGSYCKDCGTIIVAQTPVEKLDHVWVDNVDRDFTCTLDGYVGGKHCENCGIQDGTMEIIPAHHIWGETYVHTEPTCGKTGIKAHDCTVCGKKEKVEDIPATGNHNFTVEVEAKDPTCLPGYTAHLACEVCGQPNEDYTEIPGDAEEGHSFPEEGWFVYQEPTCTEAGMMAGKCEYCGKTFGLFYIDPAHVDEDEDGVCDVCKENMPTEEPECEHVWGEGEVTTAPTCTTAGVKTYTCTVEGCGATKTEDVPATGEHSFTVDVEAKAPTCEEAGYTAHKECEECGAKNDEYQVVGPHTVGEDGVCTGCGNVFVETAEELIAALEAGKNVVLTADITMDATLKCPYGNPVGVAQKGGVLDGNGHTLTVNGSGNYYAIITYGGTIKNLKINAGFRAVVTYTPTEDVVLDNVTIVGDSIGYGFNTAEHATLEGIDLVVKNSTICGWVSFDGGFESVSFENCNFVQGTYNNNVVGRLVKPYVSTTFTNCTFVKNAYLDLSALAAGETVTLVGCKVAGVDVTVDVFTTEEDHAEIPFTYEEPKGVELVLTAVEGGVSFHRHNFAIDVAGKDATCTEDGYTAHKACACGYTEGKEEVAATGEHTWNDGEVTTAPTCTAAGVKTFTCTVEGCGETKTEAVDALNHVDANGDFLCDYGCKTVMVPEEGSTLTIAQALALAELYKSDDYSTGHYNENWYYVTGVIASAPDAKYGGCTITDGTDSIAVYGLKDSTGSDRYEYMDVKPVKGDTVKIYGQVGAYAQTPQMNNSNVVEHTAHTCEWVDATCKAPKTCALCEKTEGAVLDHTYVDGKCTGCGREEGSAALSNATIKFDDKANRTEFSSTKQVWVQNGITVINDKGSSSSNIGDYSNPARFYKGTVVTVEGAGMKTVTFVASGESKYKTPLEKSLKAISGATVTVNGDQYTIVFDNPVDTFSFTTTAQIRVGSITVNP